MVIPNSKIVINPGDSNDAWRKELYLRPGDWFTWVGVSVVAATVMLAAVVLVLHLNEKVCQILIYIIVTFVMLLSHISVRRRIGEKESLASHQLRRAVALSYQMVIPTVVLLSGPSGLCCILFIYHNSEIVDHGEVRNQGAQVIF